MAAETLTAVARTLPGTLRQEIRIGRHTVVADQPVEAGGTDLGPSPHELFVGALAACVSTTLASYARAKGWDLGEIAVDAEYERKSVPRRVHLVVRVDAELTPEQRLRLEKVAAACPLRRSLDAGFVFHERLRGGAAKAA
jgi:putative redox protein